MRAHEKPRRLHLLLPVYEDWPVASLLLGRIDEVLLRHDLEAEVLLVDDGSTCAAEEVLRVETRLAAIGRLRILELKRNLGHQRAIAVGLAFIEQNLEARPVLVMDSDGEDDPADIPALCAVYEREKGHKVIFAARHRRSESWSFQIFYRFFQLLHLLLTGRGVRVGNFSILPPRALERLVVSSEVWSHYAAAITNTRIPYALWPTARAKRLGGKSRMNFTSLVVHGLSALSLYIQTIGVRLLALAFMLILGGTGLVAIALAFDKAALADPVFFFGLFLLVILLQATLGGLLYVFLLLSLRQMAVVLPARDFQLFIRRSFDWPLRRSPDASAEAEA